MALVFKTGVDPGAALEPIRYAIAVAEQIYVRYGADLAVTSLREGEHIAGSLHPVGLAADFRTRELAPGQARAIAGELAAALGGDYDVILEANHIHVEYDPRGGVPLPPITTLSAPAAPPGFPPEVILPSEFRLWGFLGEPATTDYQEQRLLGVPWWGWWLAGGFLLLLAWPRRP